MPGIQIADVIANSVWRALSDSQIRDKERYQIAVRSLMSDYVVRVKSLSLAEMRPSWLAHTEVILLK